MPDETDDAARIQRVTMPKWGLSMKTGKIVDWFVSEGDTIAKGDDIVDIETDKIAGTLESPVAGPLRRIVAEPGTDLPVGAVLAVVAPEDVPDAEIDAVVEEARAAVASGALEEADEPEPQLVEVGGRTISYLSLGPEDAEGDPVVLVHGYGGDKNSWLFVQRPLVEEGRRAIAVDLPGHGASGKDVGDGSLRTLTECVSGFLDALGIGRAHLVGHSLGAAVAAAVAQAAPAKVASLTLIAPAGFTPEVDAEYLRGFAAATSRRELKPLVGRLFADEALVTRRLVDDLLRYKRLDGVDKALTAILGTLLEGDRQALDTPALLAGVEVPVTVVWGASDRIVPVPEGVELTRVAAGHMAHMEAPGEVLAAVRARL